MQNNKSSTKLGGRVYTPQYIVLDILDLSGYQGCSILKKHVIDNSCGDGAFLVEIVKRYCESAVQIGMSPLEIANDLGTFIHGIEIDKTEWQKCLKNVSDIAKSYCVSDVNWDIICADAMCVTKYNGRMDFVLGNPPYIRIHNCGNSVDKLKTFSFAQFGMTDFYLVFYEIGLKMLSKHGVLGYITPSSFFTSNAGNELRKYLLRNNLIENIVDLKHFQPFISTTYTTIVILKNFKNDSYCHYFGFDEQRKSIYHIDRLLPEDFVIKGNFYFSTNENLRLLKNILNNTGNCKLAVKNGYATLCDEVFIENFDYDSKYLIPVVKASTGKFAKILYPYDKNAIPIAERDLMLDNNIYRYLLSNKEKLMSRSVDKIKNIYWYEFGRSQALKDTYKSKIALNQLVRTTRDLKLTPAPSGVGVYGGLYLVGGVKELERAKRVLLSEEFVSYVTLLGKYKSGGYYTFSSKDVRTFLNYKLS